MISKYSYTIFLSACLFLSFVINPRQESAAAEATLSLRIASPAPAGSSWHRTLLAGAERWKALSSGRVTLRYFPGGVAGSDPDVVRKMRLGALDGGLLTAVGLAEIDKSCLALGVPMMYESYDEVYYVLDRLRPRLEAGLLARGFVVLAWADAGWARFFTQVPVAAPGDLRPLKLLASTGDPRLADAWRSADFLPVPLPATETTVALQNGLVQGLAVPPQVAVLGQYFRHAQNMTDLRWHLLLSAIVVNRAAWERIPADLRPALLEAMREAGAQLRAEIRNSESKDIEAMRKRGLNVVPVSAPERAEWRKVALSMYPKIRGPIVPIEAFDEALRNRDEFRRGPGGAE